MGRDREKELTEIQAEDLRIMKKHYKNVMDIYTYDDLIRMLERIISAFEKEST